MTSFIFYGIIVAVNGLEELIQGFTKLQKKFLVNYAFHKDKQKAVADTGVRYDSVGYWMRMVSGFTEVYHHIRDTDSFYQDAVSLYIRRLTPAVLTQWEELALRPWDKTPTTQWSVKKGIQENILKLGDVVKDRNTPGSFGEMVQRLREAARERPALPTVKVLDVPQDGRYCEENDESGTDGVEPSDTDREPEDYRQE